jgi:membrane associated rhomboid family serine protease
LVKKIFLSKGLYFPYVSLILILSCLVVSLAAHNSAPLFAYLVPWENIYQKYQLFTSLFVHGVMKGFRGMSFELHLITNLVTIAFFGVFCERILGPSKIFLLSLISAFINILVRLALNSFGSGVSGISWAYVPLASYIFFMIYRQEKREFFSSILSLLGLILLFLSWIGVTAGNFIMGWHTNNLFHLAAVLTGVIFLIVWKKAIDNKFNRMIVKGADTTIFHRLTIRDIVAVIASLVILISLGRMVITFFEIW